MSDTIRWTQPGWDYPGSHSKKHQQSDRKPIGRSPRSRGRKARQGRFTKYGRNRRGNLLSKIDQIREKESMNEND